MRHIDERGRVEPQFALAIGAMFEARGKEATDGQIKMYARALDALPLEAVAEACVRSHRDLEFFPTPQALLKLAGGGTEDRALLAWAAFERAAADAGAYSSLEVEDGAAAEALLAVCGSWPEFCAVPEGPASAIKRQEFLAAYRRATARARPPRRLAGLLEAGGSHAAGPAAGCVWVARLGADGVVQARRDVVRDALGPGPRQLEDGR